MLLVEVTVELALVPIMAVTALIDPAVALEVIIKRPWPFIEVVEKQMMVNSNLHPALVSPADVGTNEGETVPIKASFPRTEASVP